MSLEHELQRQILALARRVADLERQELGVFGSWTPVFAGSGTTGTIVYSLQIGRYARVGQICYVQGYLAVSGITVAPTGTLRVTGLPITTLNAASVHCAPAVGWANLNLSAGYTQQGLITEPNSTYLRVVEMGGLIVHDFPAASLVVGNHLIFSGVYIVE